MSYSLGVYILKCLKIFSDIFYLVENLKSLIVIRINMGLKKYSELIKRTRRGSNAFPLHTLRKLAYRNVEQQRSSLNLPILEVGCGRGYKVQALLENNIPCVGIDIDLRQLKYARTRMKRHGLDTHVYQADAKNLPFKDNSFGGVISYGMLMMVPFVKEKTEGKTLSINETREEVKKILSEMKRVVGHDGTVNIITFSDKEKIEPKYYKPTPSELEELGRKVKLTPINVDYHKEYQSTIDCLFKKE